MRLKAPDSRRLADNDAETVRRAHHEAIRELQRLHAEVETALDALEESVTGGTGIGPHTHPESDITGLVADLAAINASLAGKIDEVVAGTNLSGGGTSGSVTLNVIDSPSFAGNVTCGNSAAADLLTVNGKAEQTSTQNDSAFEITLNTTGMTAVNSACLRVNNTSTVSTAAGNNNAAGIWSTISCTESAGANTLTNIAGFFSASGGDVNEALRTDAGNVNLNRTGGTTTIGGACTCSSTLAVTSTFSCNGNATLGDAAGDSHTINGSATITNGLSVTGGNVVITNNLTANGNTALGNASGDTTTVLGRETVTYTPSALTSTTSAIIGQADGTYNTTGGALISRAVHGQCISTRSSGGNNLTNVALWGNASGAQVNYALYCDAGDVRLNATSGSTTIVGALSCSSTVAIDGNATIGNAAGDSHTVNGTFTIVNEARLGSSSGPLVRSGSGTPEGAITAPVGSLFLRTDGGAGTSFYVKESGAGNTGWVGK